MKPKSAIRSFLALTSSSLLAISYTHAANLYWDGATPAGAPTGGSGTWDTSAGNWDNTPSADSSTAWVNANLDTAVFGSTAGTATLGTGITVGGLTFNTTAYVIDSSASTLSFGAGNNTILFNNIAAATINNAVGGTGNVILTAANTVTAGTLTLGLASAGGWSGTTTVNAGMTLLLNGANQGLLNTTGGITLNGGNITTANTNTAQSTLNRISDTSAITSNGGTFTYTNTAGANLNYTETLGSVELGRGQTNFLLTTTQNNVTNNSQTLILSGLTRTGASNTSVAAFLAGTTGPQISSGDNMIRVNGITTSTATGQIHGPWATTGVSATSQSDYARYVSDGTNGFITAAGITHSLESTWTTAANAYTFNGATPKAAAVLSGTRNMTGLKVSTVSSATGAADSTTERVTWTAHGLVEGAPFVLSGGVTGGLATAVVYYARNVTANDFQISLTPTGSIIDLTNTSANAGLSPGILVSSGNNLGTTGILTTEGVTTAITAIGTGVVTLPSTTSAALYVSTVGPGASNLIIQAPITDNGAGVLTLVKSGVGGGTVGTHGILTLAGTNTFTGGIVVNSGTVRLSAAQSFTGGVTLNGGIFGDSTNGITAAELNGNNITVNGLAAMDVDGSGDNITGTVTINSAAVFKLTNDAATAQVSGVVSGTGILDVGQSGGSGSNITLTHTANTFTGGVLYSANNNGGFNLSVNSFLDSASPGAGNIVMGYGGTTSTQTFTLHTGAIAPMTFTNRQFELQSSASGQTLKIANNSSQAFAINSNLNTSAGSGTKTLTLGGTGTGLSTFGGTITNGGFTTLNLSKLDAGTWSLTNTSNSYTGTTTVSGGVLGFASGALGSTGTINASGGTLQWGSSNTQDISSRLATTGGALTTLDTNGNNVIFASAVGTANNGQLAKTGLGTLTLTLTNNYTGSTIVNGGTLSLDYASNASKLSDTTQIALGGGTLNLAGGSHTEVVVSSVLTANTGSYVTRTSGSSVLQMNAIANNTGTVNIGADNIATTLNTNNATGILGTWATVGGDWATSAATSTLNVVSTAASDTITMSGMTNGNSVRFTANAPTGVTLNTVYYIVNATGSDFQISATPGGSVLDITADGATGTLNVAGAITAYTGYSDVTLQNSGPKAIPNTSTANVRIVEGTGGSPDVITLAAATTSINTLSQSTSNAATISLAGQTLRTDSILMGPTAGALTIGASPGSGTLSSTAATGSIIVTNNSSNLLTINSVIANNTTTGLVKNGTGVLVLTAASTYTGGTILQDGTIRAGASTGDSNGILGSTNNAGITIANKSTAVFDVNGFNVAVKDLSGGGALGGNVTLGSGTLYIGNPSNGSTPYAGIISGTNGNLRINGSASWNTTGAHTYTGITTIGTGAVTLITNNLQDGGIASGMGASSNAAANLIFTGGILRYTSTSAASTDRRFTLAGNAGLGVGGAGAITWSNTAAVTYSGAGIRTLTLSADGTGLGTLAADIDNNVSDAVSITKTGTSNWMLTNAGSGFTGAITLNTTTTSAGTLSYASAGGANAISFAQTTSTATLSYIGSGQTMSGLIQANALSTGTVTLDSSGAGAVNYSNTASLGNGGAIGAKGLVLSGTNTGNNTLAGQWVNNTAGGAATLTKNGTGAWTLTNSHTYTGATTINAGTLTITGATLDTTAITVGASGRLGLGLSTVAAASASVTLGGTVQVTGTPTLASYTLLTASSITGTPVLATPIPGYTLVIDGGNTLKLNSTGGPVGFAAWQAANGTAGTRSDDHDNDGVDNGTEHFIYGTVPNSGFTLLPGVTNTLGVLSVTWAKAGTYTGNYTTDYVVETSTTLDGLWTVETIPGGNITDTLGSVKYTFPGGPAYTGKRFARLKVTGP